MSTELPLFWLSFADGTLPTGTQFLGVVIIRGTEFVEAVKSAHRLGINPGGEVKCTEIEADIPPEYMDRLLSRESLAELEKLLKPPAPPDCAWCEGDGEIYPHIDDQESVTCARCLGTGRKR